jgi:predicted lipoprotein with Yx(FWY)xxD motif
MFHQRGVFAGIGIAAAIAIGAAVLTSSHGISHAAAGSAGASSIVRTQTASVGGNNEAILTDAYGLPLYYYAPDTAAKSLVAGGLATLWPPVTSTGTPAATGLAGQLRTIRDSHGSQIAYNGHLLYTFVSDRAGVVTGEGVQNFFVATPNLPVLAGSPASTSTSPASTYGGY